MRLFGGDWDVGRAAAIVIGGAAGAALRWAVVSSVEAEGFPWPVFAINVAGSLALGMLLAAEWSHASTRALLHNGGAIGFCGGLTTFSTFSVEVVNMYHSGATVMAAAYAVASTVAAMAGITAGARALRRGRAVTMPLEENP